MDHQDISKIANQLGSEWLIFGAHLGYSDAQLENLREIYQFRPNDRNNIMLHKWYQQAETLGDGAMFLLAAHLEEAGCKHLADELVQDASIGKERVRNISEEEKENIMKAIRKIDFDIKETQQSVFVAQKVKGIINCLKCKRLFHKPKNLPCSHTFCHRCIVSLLETNDRTCPICKEFIMLSREEEVDKLTTNSLISDLVAINKKYEFWPLNNTSNRSCDMCNKPESMDFCVDCLTYMCRTCSAAHSKWPALKTHKTLEVNSENEPIIELRKKVPLCKTHRKEVVSFCLSCRIGVCEDCRGSCPDDHVFDDLHSHCKDKRKEIDTSVKASTEVILKYSECIEKFDTKKHDLLQEKEEALNEVDVIMNLVRELLERKASGMRSDIDEKYARKCQQLDVELENVTKEKTKLLSLVEYLKFLHEYGSDAHIVTECDDKLSFCTALCLKPNLDNLETFIIDFRRNPSLEQMLLGLNIGTVDNYYIYNEAFDKETFDPSTLKKDVKEIFQQSHTHTGNLMSTESDCSVDEDERELQAPFRRRPSSPPRPLEEILPPPLPPRDLCVQPSYAESSKQVIKSKNLDEHKESNEKMLACNKKAKRLDCIDGQNLHEEAQINERGDKEASNELVYHYAGSDTSDDDTFQTDSSFSEGGVHVYDESAEPEGEQKCRNVKDEIEKFRKLPQDQEKRFGKTHIKTTQMATQRKERMLHDFNISVSGMAVSTEDIALISFNSKCINILHYKQRTFSSVSHESNRIGAPFDGVYSEDMDNKTGLFFTETDKEKRGVKILYKKNVKLKLVCFTNQIEEPRGISANDRNVFVCDRSKCSILVFKKDGELILSVSKKYSRFDMPMYVFADGLERLVVTDPNTHSVRALSGIEDMCTVVDMYNSFDFMLGQKMKPGKCCVDKNGAILIPDGNNCKLLNCSSKQPMNLAFLRTLGEAPAAVARLKGTKIVVATATGKIFAL